ncbi:MAG: AsmA family protein [Alphaproteobacteria bacterium]|nr:AsmA family protein [Alphaproteobacteria bacterium]
MRRILIIVAAVIGVLVVVALILPFVVPVDAYRGQIEQQASTATGRQLKINGELRLSIFPTLGVKAEQVTLANVPGGEAPYFASMDSLGVGVKLLPLLSGKVEVSQVTLNKPVINLEVEKDGKGNWALGAQKQAAETAAAKPGGGLGAAATATFKGVSIKNGRITYRNAVTGKHRSFDAINVTVAITSLVKPISVDGSLVSDGQKISMDGTVSDPKALMNGSATPVDLSLTSDLLQASFKGTLASGGNADGALKLDTPSVRKLAVWAGIALPTGGGLGHLSLEGHIAAKGSRDDFSAIRLLLDGQTLTGALSVDRAGTIPFLSGALGVDHLNLNPYMVSAAASGNGKAPSTPPPNQGWSKTPIDFSALRLMNAKLTLNVGAIQMKSLKLGKTALALTLNGGALAADLNPVTLYGGAGRATLKVDASGATPTIAETTQFDNLAMRSFLTDAIGVSRIEGTGMLALDITGSGDSTNTIMHSLAGKGAILFKNGRIHGVDLAAVAQTIQNALSGAAVSSGASTSFTEMGGTFTIASGVMTNKDFHLLSPFIRMTGAGTINLGEQTIDFVVSPKAVASLQGQGGSQSLRGLGVPFHITGSWSHLHYSPDLSGVAKDILNSVMKGGISSKSVLQGLFGGPQTNQQTNPQNPQQQPQQQQQKKKKNPLDVLQGLFGH